MRDRRLRLNRPPNVQKTITTRIPTNIIKSAYCAQQYAASIHCSHIQTFHATLQRWEAQPKTVTNLLLLGFFEEEKWNPANSQDDSNGMEVVINITLTVNDNYIQDSFTLGDTRW